MASTKGYNKNNCTEDVNIGVTVKHLQKILEKCMKIKFKKNYEIPMAL